MSYGDNLGERESFCTTCDKEISWEEYSHNMGWCNDCKKEIPKDRWLRDNAFKLLKG